MLLDTCILIDVINKQPSARAFFQSIDKRPYISVLSVMEILHGARQKEAGTIVSLLGNLHQIPVSTEIAVHAASILKTYVKSHHVSPVDALIASTAQTMDLEMVTLNRKHFPMFPDLKRPY